MRIKYYWIIFILIIFSSLLKAQGDRMRFDNITIQDGLPENSGRVMIQDRQGYIWIGTQNGLVRYDGLEMEVFRHDPDNPYSLKSNLVTSLREDFNGRIWISGWFQSAHGLSCYDPATQRFLNFFPKKEDSLPLWANSFTWTILLDKDKNLWIGGDYGLYQFKVEQLDFLSGIIKLSSPKAYSLQAEKNGTPNTRGIYQIYLSIVGELWVASTYGLGKYNKSQDSFQHYLMYPEASEKLNVFNDILEDKSGKLWLGTDKGIASFDPSNVQFFHYTDGLSSLDQIKDEEESWRCQWHPDGSIWFVDAHKGVARFFPSMGKYHFYGNRLFDNYLGQGIVSILIDYTGIIWVGTYHGGLFRSNTWKSNIQYFSHNPQDSNSLNSNKIYAIHKDGRGSYWIGTNKGLMKWNRTTDKFHSIQLESAINRRLKSKGITEIISDGEGNIWLATSRDGLMAIDSTGQVTKWFKHDPEDSLSISSNSPHKFALSQRGGIWIAPFTSTLNYFEPTTNKFYRYPIDNDLLEDLYNAKSISALFEDRSGMLWVGTNLSGLHKFDPNKKMFNLALTSIAEGGVVQENDSILWISTFLDGIIRLNQKSGTAQNFTEKEGLSFNTVTGIHKNNSSRYWLATHRGISIMNPITYTFQNYTVQDGLPFNHIENLFQAPDGELFFSNFTDGFFSLHPDKVLKDSMPPRIVFKDIYLHNKVITVGEEDAPLKKHVSLTKEINFTYNQNDISLEFAALHFKNSEKNQFLYKLENYDQNWLNPGKNRIVKYTNLSPGEYIFQVKAANSDGVWNEKGLSLAITIHPPWWQTTIAYFLYLVAVIGMVWAIILWRTSVQQKELDKEKKINQRLQTVDKLKDQFLANTSHELRTPLNGIIGLAESLKDGAAGQQNAITVQNLDLIATSGKRLANLVNDILDFSKLKNHDLELQLKPVDLHAVVELVLQLSKSLILHKDIELINAVPKNIALAHADENRLQQILHNLIGNAIKFTQNGSVKIAAEEIEDKLRVAISDTGIGIPEYKFETIFQSFEQADGATSREYGGTGLGLSVTKQLVELHGGIINVRSKVGIGSIFSFTLPIYGQKLKAIDKKKQEWVATESLVRNGLSQALPSKIENKRLVAVEEESTEMSNNLVAKEAVKILIVDDEPVNLQVLDNHLSLAGYQVTKAANGQEALDIIQHKTFDLIILDIMMPRMSGYEVCHQLRDNFLPSELPVVMLTAKNRVNDLVEGFKVGANDYLTKPFSKDELLSRIKTHLNLHRINKAMGSFVPSEFLRTIGRESITEVQLGDQTQREVTVLFTDIRNYTALSEQMSPEENFRFVNAYVGRMGPIIQQHHGFVNQYLGDGIMAIFQNNPADALKAAIAMQQAVRQYNDQRIAQNRKPIKVGMGLHTGPLIMGIIGDKNRKEPATISDTVNAASRMEGLTKHYGAQILLSQTSLEKLNQSEVFNLRNLGKVQVKGKQEAIGVFECFDGEDPTVFDIKKQTQKLFSKGINHYLKKQFPEASMAFQQILNQNDKDLIAKFFLNKTGQYIAQGVPEDWTGVELRDRK